jgi:alpha-galactosidase
MDFGLWVEPEMVNLDSELVRAHPDWLLPPPRHVDAPALAEQLPRSWRHQYVLDIAHPDAHAHLLRRLDTLVGEVGVAFLKWDHNRDLHETGAHAQTLALYSLLDELRARHPGLEIESCASGGARIDLGIAERTERVWASDTNDPVERQQIQRWTSSLLPLELIGSHIGGPVAHTTGRVSDLSLRAITALFAHAGIEWDITACSDAELVALRRWAELYKELRPLLHSGELVRLDAPERPDGHLHPDVLVHGVVAQDRSEAVFALVRIRTSPTSHPGRLYLAGLEPARRYRVMRRDEAGIGFGQTISQPPWWQSGGTEASGAVLARVGLAAPSLNPGQGVLVHLRAV